MGSHTILLLIGFGMMLISGVYLYFEYQYYKELGEGKTRWWFEVIGEMVLEGLLSISGSIISSVGFFILGLIIVVLTILELFGVINLGLGNIFG